jgi:hypothetical protein
MGHGAAPRCQPSAVVGIAHCVSRPATRPPSDRSFFKPFSQSGQILYRFRLALQRKSGPRVALPAHRLYYPVVSRYMASVDHTGLLRRSPRCSNGRPSDRLRFFMCRLVICGSCAGQSRRKSAPPPSRQRATWLAVCRRREKRPSSSTPGRQTKWGGCREGPLASDIGSFSHGRAAQTRLGAQDCIA